MCLKLIDASVQPKIATKDIVVYKGLKTIVNRNVHNVKDGEPFVGRIKGIKCSGKFRRVRDGEMYLCTNKSGLDGWDCHDKLGYKYSWSIDSNVSSLIVNGVELVKHKYITPYRDFDVEIGETYTSELVKDDCSIEVGLHSFVTIEDAKRDGHSFYIKCVIPKGSKYYEGFFGSYKSYASDTLTYVEIVK